MNPLPKYAALPLKMQKRFWSRHPPVPTHYCAAPTHLLLARLRIFITAFTAHTAHRLGNSGLHHNFTYCLYFYFFTIYILIPSVKSGQRSQNLLRLHAIFFPILIISAKNVTIMIRIFHHSVQYISAVLSSIQDYLMTTNLFFYRF